MSTLETQLRERDREIREARADLQKSTDDLDRLRSGLAAEREQNENERAARARLQEQLNALYEVVTEFSRLSSEKGALAARLASMSTSGMQDGAPMSQYDETVRRLKEIAIRFATAEVELEDAERRIANLTGVYEGTNVEDLLDASNSAARDARTLSSKGLELDPVINGLKAEIQILSAQVELGLKSQEDYKKRNTQLEQDKAALQGQLQALAAKNAALEEAGEKRHAVIDSLTRVSLRHDKELTEQRVAQNIARQAAFDSFKGQVRNTASCLEYQVVKVSKTDTEFFKRDKRNRRSTPELKNNGLERLARRAGASHSTLDSVVHAAGNYEVLADPAAYAVDANGGIRVVNPALLEGQLLILYSD